MIKKKPIVAITMGDPSGIGPEIIIKIFSNPKLFKCCRPLVIGDLSVMKRIKNICKAETDLRPIEHIDEARFSWGAMDLVDLKNIHQRFRFGHPVSCLGQAMVEYIQKAVDWALKGKVHGITTAPISKILINEAGFSYPGHTELLANLTGVSKCVMMLIGGPFRISLVTTHLPIGEVPRSLTSENIFNSIFLTDKMLFEAFGIKKPKIAVSSLNPHGGEDTLLGKEEKRIILPAINRAVRQGIQAMGPYPPDTLFWKAKDGKAFDGIVVMYHDQGLIPLKLVSFGYAVNLTLGLPIIRTSVDHGTAYDIAGKGVANPSSLWEAVKLATELSGKNMDKKKNQATTPLKSI